MGDYVVDATSQEKFFVTLRAMLGMDGEPAICQLLERIILVHKHQQSYCIGGYQAPVPGAKPSITQADGCSHCLFLQGLQDAGFTTKPWQPPPVGFEHPFVECWTVGVCRPCAA